MMAHCYGLLAHDTASLERWYVESQNRESKEQMKMVEGRGAPARSKGVSLIYYTYLNTYVWVPGTLLSLCPILCIHKYVSKQFRPLSSTNVSTPDTRTMTTPTTFWRLAGVSYVQVRLIDVLFIGVL